MPRCYMVKKCIPRDEGSQPCSPTEASVAPPYDSPNGDSANTEQSTAEYAELGGGPLSQRSAADKEAALELLSLAQSLPPLPPAAVVTVLQVPEPTPIVPVYVYTSPPTNIYIVTDKSQGTLYQAVQTAPTVQSVEYVIDQSVNYVAYEQQPTIRMVVEENVKPPEKEKPLQRDSVTQTKKKVVKYNCRECGKSYATSSNLSRHKQTHRSLDSGAAKHCTVCGKVYVSMPALSMHVLTHRMEHICSFCGKEFSRSWLLRGHLRLHTGEKPYKCTTCGKAFADRSNLRAHIQTHSSSKLFECTRCHKTFALKSYLNKHRESACVFVEDK